MQWDRTGEENNSGAGGKRVENEMGLNGRGEQQWQWREENRERNGIRTGEENSSGTGGGESRECNGIERERKTTVALEGRE